MGLQGPFPAILEIETEDEGWALLRALATATKHAKFYKDDERAERSDKLYAKVLFACGDD